MKKGVNPYIHFCPPSTPYQIENRREKMKSCIPYQPPSSDEIDEYKIRNEIEPHLHSRQYPPYEIEGTDDILNCNKLKKKVIKTINYNPLLYIKLKRNRAKQLKSKVFDFETNYYRLASFIEKYGLLSSINICEEVEVSFKYDVILISTPSYNVCNTDYPLSINNIIKSISVNILNEIIKFQSVGLHHGNICINNIYVNENGEYRLFDYFHRMFEIDKIDLEYYFNISPEEIQGKEVTNASDMWQLGQLIKKLIGYDSLDLSVGKYNEREINIEMKKLTDKLTDLNPKKRLTAKEMLNILLKRDSLFDINDYIHNRIDKGIIYNNGLFEIILTQLKDIDVDLIGDLKNFISYYCNRYLNNNDSKSFGFILNLALKYPEVLNLLKEFYFEPDSFQEKVIIAITEGNELNLYANDFNNEDFLQLTNVMEYMKDLKKFNFGGYEMKKEELEKLKNSIEKNVQIEKLSLFYFKIDKEGIKTIISSIAVLKNLKSLNLERNNIDEKGIRMLCGLLRELHNLKELNISFNPIGPDGMKVLGTFSEYLNNLSELNISHCKIQEKGAECFYKKCSKNLTNLQVLNISYNSLFQGGGKSLLSALYFKDLIKLDLSYNYIKSDSVKNIIYRLSKYSPKLKTLNISGNAIKSPPKLHIDESGIEWLDDSILVMKSISVLKIDDNNLNSRDIRLLQKYSCLFDNLEELSMSSNNIEDVNSIVSCLRNFKNLKKANFKSNRKKFSSKDVSSINKVLPNLILEIEKEEPIPIFPQIQHVTTKRL